MRFEEFKKRYTLATRGDIAINDDELRFLLKPCINEIVRQITPLELIEIDHRNFEVDYFIDNKYFVRKVQIPQNDNDLIGFADEALLEALIYSLAYKRGFDMNLKQQYRREYLKNLNQYELNNFNENSYDLDTALALKGWAKPYEINYALDEFYVWDSEFIDNLDFYMANVPSIKNLSYAKFIYLFIDYQNNKQSPSQNVRPQYANEQIQRADLAALDKLMSAKIKEI